MGGDKLVVGFMLGPAEMGRLGEQERYRRIAQIAGIEGIDLIYFDRAGLGDGSIVQGWRWTGDQLCPVESPLPVVIYNRATYGNRAESQEAIALLRRLTARRQTWLLNSVNAFSKADVSEALHFFRATRGLAPESRELTGGSDLAELLNRHTSLYIKGNQGSHGDDVVRLRVRSGRLALDGRIGGTPVAERFSDLNRAYAFLDLLRPPGGWMVQQGIELPRIDGRLLDLRVIAQKDGQGYWQLPLLLLRLAQPGRVAANMCQGGEPFLPESFRERYGDRLPGLESVLQTAREAARLTALALESRSGLLGEVGVDLGFDATGAVWIFEANTKPLHPQVPGFDREALAINPLAYARYLAERAAAAQQDLSGPVSMV